MPQRITVDPGEVRRVVVDPSEVTRTNVENPVLSAVRSLSQQSTAPAPFQSPIYPGPPTSATNTGTLHIPAVGSFSRAGFAEAGRAASEHAGYAMTGLGLDKPILGAVDLVNDIRGMFKRDTPEQQQMLRAGASERANRAKPIQQPPNPKAPLPPMGAENLKNLPAVIGGTVKAGATAVPHTAQSIGTTARGAASLAAPSIPSPTEEEFKQASTGAGEGLGLATTIVGGVKGLRSAKTQLKAMRADIPIVQRDAALGSLAKSGIKKEGVTPYRIANESREGMKYGFNKFGIDPESLPTKNSSPYVNEMVIGGTEDDLARVNKILEAEHNEAIAAGKLPEDVEFRPVDSIQLAAADEMVNYYHQPIQNAVDRFAEVSLPEVKRKIIADLTKRAVEEADRNPELSAAFDRTVKQITNTGDTVAEFNALKVKSNKMPHRGRTGSPSQQIASDVLTSEAQFELGNSIRHHLYPAIENIGLMNGKPMQGALLKAGRREASAIITRDGIYKEWSKAAYGQSTAEQNSWWNNLVHGSDPNAVPPIGVSPTLVRGANLVSRAVTGPTKPMANFNRLLGKGTGSTNGFIGQQSVVTPRREISSVSEVTSPSAPRPPQSTWGEIPPVGMSRIGGVEYNPGRLLPAGKPLPVLATELPSELQNNLSVQAAARYRGNPGARGSMAQYPANPRIGDRIKVGNKMMTYTVKGWVESRTPNPSRNAPNPPK